MLLEYHIVKKYTTTLAPDWKPLGHSERQSRSWRNPDRATHAPDRRVRALARIVSLPSKIRGAFNGKSNERH